MFSVSICLTSICVVSLLAFIASQLEHISRTLDDIKGSAKQSHKRMNKSSVSDSFPKTK